MTRRNALVFSVLIVICVGVFLWWQASPGSDTNVVERSGSPAADKPAERQGVASSSLDSQLQLVKNRPIQVARDGYVGASSCERCHQQQHHSWHASFHRTMTQVVSPESAPLVIENATVQLAGETYEFNREDDRYFVTFDDPIEQGNQRVKKELVMMTGSHHMNVFWYESPFLRTPSMLPIVFLLDQQRWILRNSAFVRPPGPSPNELGRWNAACCNCHSTHSRGRLNPKTREWDTHVSDFGIACEACHGPGKGHIEFYDGDKTTSEKNDVVVNPNDLSHDIQSHLCAQCHSLHVHDFDSFDTEEFLENGAPFRPGDDLTRSLLRNLVRATPEFQGTAELKKAMKEKNLKGAFWGDGTVRVSGREFTAMAESPCYQAGELSCLSCHEMHPDELTDLDDWRDDQLKPEMRTNHSCTQCHGDPKYTTELSKHTHHKTDSHGSNCMNCHMPHTTYGLLKSIRSHRIESPSVETTLRTARPNGCVLCHLDQDIGWAADHLTQWYGQQKLELNEPIARETASAAVSFLLGDAGLRAVYASTFAWKPAQEASGTDWMPPYLLIGMLDEYDAVRIICKRTLKTIPGWEDVEIDELASAADRAKTVGVYLKKIKQEMKIGPRPKLLIDEDGKFQFTKASQMFNARDKRPITLEE